MKTTILAAAAAIAGLLNSQAYVLENVKWLPGNVPFYLDLGPYNSIAKQELATWDQYTGNTHLRATNNSATNGSTRFYRDGRSSITWSDSVNYDLAGNILGVCFLNNINGTSTLREADVVINSGFDWAQTFNIGWVLLHEIGHAIGLGHSDSGGVMQTYYSGSFGQIAELNADDIAGAKFIYGPRTVDNVPESGSTAALFGGAIVLLSLARTLGAAFAHL